MEILVDWLKNSDRSKASIDQLICKYSKEIESIESSIRDKLNVRDEEQFRDCFQKIKKSIGEMNESLDQVNDQLKNFESDTAVKIKELKDVLIQRNKQLQEAAKLTSDDEDADDAVKSKDFLDDDIEHYKQLDRDARDFSLSPSPTRSLTPVDAEEVRQVELTKQIAGEYIIEARKLISSDLFPINDVGEDVSKVIHSNSPTINQSLFSFPVCQVSQSIYDLAKLLKKMMKDARTRSDPEERYIIYQAVRSVLELYLISCQTNRKKTVKYTAVFHNNCLFISHQLTMLPMEYGLWDKDKFIVTFIDLIPALKESAYDAIIDLMKQNKQLIMDFFEEPSVIEALKAASREDSSGSRSLLPFSKALKRGLTHIDQIKTSMIDCLPISVCNKLVGTLVNCLIAGMINSILGMEDIPADTASRLGDILDEITKEIDQLMESFSLPYGQILPKWLQFQEIKIILQAGLKDIVDRWSDGNGPLAVAFTPEEVKSLIRSLFQNTDRRSTALARIR